MGAKRILALGSVAALCAGAAAPLFMASAAFAAQPPNGTDATFFCLPAGSPPSPVIGAILDLPHGTPAAIADARVLRGHRRCGSGLGRGDRPDRRTGVQGVTGVQGGTGGTGGTGLVGNTGLKGIQGVTGIQGGSGGTGGTGGSGPERCDGCSRPGPDGCHRWQWW